MHPMLNVAVRAVRKAGIFIIRQYELLDKNIIRSVDIRDFVSRVNFESDSIIEEIIHKFYPLHIVITTKNTQNFNFELKSYQKMQDTFWMIRSIDSSINFIKQFPFFALSIAIQIKGHVEIGVIYDPIHNELFSACRGRGAWLNGYRIRVNTTKSLHNSILAISCILNRQDTMINLINKLSLKCVNFRYTGESILDFVYVAAGRLDGCIAILVKNINRNQKILASAILIIRESGGFIIDFAGTDNYFMSGNVIVGNIKVTRMIYAIIQESE
ncbi:inositol monophosphatase family protein [Candidatus Blochmannia ocreatus (nom. nud.)]|uniref:Inositol-1-monophosphatase n=1 Tax=Candidatus Blochmannia ocreatus (nom. nud.) TaxID=251538 RepID=A0ABY4ST12_9ENTR|nr:inositol monophosphatase family protein [Candidatus Blochmannia ocreatus]URJ25016.1 inositol monophosphatase [Candidatus Blochmannia ocreatus]